MPFLLLLILLPPCIQDSWPAPGLGIDSPFWAAVLTWSLVGLSVAVSAGLAWRVRRVLYRIPDRRDVLARRYGPMRTWFLFGLFGMHLLALYGFGWGWAVQTLVGGAGERPHMPAGSEALILAPFLTALFGSWVCFYDAERALHDNDFWTRWEYVSYQARNSLLLILIPVGLMVFWRAAGQLFPFLNEEWRSETSLLAIVVALSAVVALPLAVRLILQLQPLPPGPLRDRLTAAAQRLGFRSSGLLIWNTRNGVANAMVTGVIPWLRYVVFTDRLLTEFRPEEVEAVFGHEVGHIKHRHLLYYQVFLMTSATAVVALAGLALTPLIPYLKDLPYLAGRQDLAVLPVVVALGVYIFVVFGYVSRRCERQADIFGCRTVSCGRPDCTGHDEHTVLAEGGQGLCTTGVKTFVSALEKVADLNGISRDRPGFLQSWQHSTIARRVDFLMRMLEDQSLEPRFQRDVALVKWGLLLSLAVVLVVLGSVYGWGIL